MLAMVKRTTYVANNWYRIASGHTLPNFGILEPWVKGGRGPKKKEREEEGEGRGEGEREGERGGEGTHSSWI